MDVDHLVSSLPRAVLSQPSSRHRRNDTHAMLHNADTTLAHELGTLSRLQAFYEQHTFDTQGPYADLFAVLLSSCKHLIDINVSLVQHIRSHDGALRRQAATCDALCSGVAKHTSDLAYLLARTPHTKSRDGTTVDAAEEAAPPAMDEDERRDVDHAAAFVCADREASGKGKACSSSGVVLHDSAARAAATSSTSSSSTQLSQDIPQRPHMRPSGSTPAAADDVMAQRHADWAAQMERRLESLHEQLATALEHHNVMQAASQQQSPSPPAPSLQADVTPLPENPSAQSVHALMESFEQWKQRFEDAMNDRLEHLARHVSTLDGTIKQHQRQLRWMGSDEGAPVQEGTDARPISRKRPETPSVAPPAAVTHWLHSALEQRERQWQRVLEDVHAALATTQKSNCERSPPSSGDATSAGLHDATLAAAPSPPPDRAWFAHSIEELLRLCQADAQQSTKALDDVVKRIQHADDELRDVVARLEVLEVYAPHRYAVAAAPPVLGVELEDVEEPRVGVRVRTVYQDYLADRAGLSVGDVIAGVGHQSVQTRAQLYVVLGELTRDYNAQCRLQVEEGYLRHFATSSSKAVDTSVFTPLETSYEDGEGASFELDHALQRARAEAASANHRADGNATVLKYRTSNAKASKIKPPFAYPTSSQHKNLLAQCLPYFELTLHVLRDGRLRDVTVLIPPSDTLRSVTQY
jgi:hypothetical protein